MVGPDVKEEQDKDGMPWFEVVSRRKQMEETQT